ncbi:MAG: response regulator transcription factor [Candidatus Synoicihabitans palmerolidicus]|nr:response regulator transcription factor [Candidatus Synoicihabitans palmerolidicus]
MLAEGLSSKEIAAKLGLSMHTVVNHRSNLMRKTGLHRVAQLSRYAVEIGLLTPSQPSQ